MIATAMRALVASLLLASTASAGSPAPTVTAQLPGVPCALSATFHLRPATKTMSYGASIRCKGAVGEKTIDVVPQVSRVLAGRLHWFNLTLAGRYQGPTPVDRVRVSDSRAYVPGHDYRLVAFGEVRSASGHAATATVCSGCTSPPPAFNFSPSDTFRGAPATAVHLAGTPCTLTQNGLVFTLVNGSYVVNYGARSSCAATAVKRTVTTCAQVANRASGRTRWLTISGSCASTGPTTADPAQIQTARTAQLGHGYRIMARTTVTQGTVTHSATVYSAPSAP